MAKVLYLRHLRSRRFQAILEIRQSLHERARALARRRIYFLLRPQVPHSPREKPLGRAYGSKRDVRDVMPNSTRRPTHLVAREFSEIDVLQDELQTRDFSIEQVTRRCEHAHASSLLDTGEHEKADEKGV